MNWDINDTKTGTQVIRQSYQNHCTNTTWAYEGGRSSSSLSSCAAASQSSPPSASPWPRVPGLAVLDPTEPASPVSDHPPPPSNPSSTLQFLRESSGEPRKESWSTLNLKQRTKKVPSYEQEQSSKEQHDAYKDERRSAPVASRLDTALHWKWHDEMMLTKYPVVECQSI